MSCGRTHSSNCASVTKPSFRAASRRRGAFAISEHRDLGGLLVADMRVERRDQHERALRVAGDLAPVRLDAPRAMIVERAAASASSIIDSSRLCSITGLKTLSWKLPCEPRTPPLVVAEHLYGHHGQRLALRRVDLARHDGGARLVLRNRELAEARRAARRQYQRTSLAIFISAPASVRSAPLVVTTASCADRAANLLGADTNGWPVSAAILAAARVAEVGMRIETRADRGAPERQGIETRQGAADAGQSARRAARPSRRSPVAGSGASRPGDGCGPPSRQRRRRPPLRCERVAQVGDGREQVALDLLDGGDVHRGRERRRWRTGRG